MAAALVGCGESGPDIGAVRISIVTTGQPADLDANGYQATGLGEALALPVATNGVLTVPNVAAGDYTLALADVAPNCQVEAPATRSIAVSRDDTTAVAWAVTCAPSGPMLTVKATTSGSPLDPDGFELIVDDTPKGRVPTSGEISLRDVPAGAHVLKLQNIALNCTADWYAPRPVTVQASAPTTVEYVVRCAAPSSRRLIFSSNRDNPARDIYRSDLSAANPERLTAPIPSWFASDQPALSPGGTRIAFTRFMGALYQPLGGRLWLMDADGTHAAPLSADPNEAQDPSWSPDGTRIAFVRLLLGITPRQLVVMTADGRNEEVLASGSSGLSIASPRWSPDGTAIAFNTVVGNVTAIRILDLRTHQSRDLVLPGDSLSMLYPTWAPSGDRLLIAVAHGSDYVSDIATIRVDGTDLTVLAPSQAGVAGFAFAPDGSEIIVSRDEGSSGIFDLFTMPAAGGALTDITLTPASHELFPNWGP